MKPREHWATNLGFLMATAGSAIGLGNLWRFPYLVGQNGGGAFVLLYLTFTLVIAIPLFIAEMLIGRAAKQGPVKAYKDLAPHSNHWHLVGWLNVIATILILSFYCVVAGWTINYAFMSLMQFTENKSPEEIRQVFDLLYHSPDITLFFHLIFIAITAGIVLGGLRKGIEYWSKILTPALFFLLLLLLFFSISLPGFQSAAHFVLYPDFSKITASSILEALGMALFTMSVGIGVLLTYGSYTHSETDIPKTSLFIALLTTGVSLLASLVIFPITFTFGFPPEEGVGLIFKTLPVLFAKLPGTLILSTVFFILVIFTALTSAISLLELLVVNFMEVFGWSRQKAVYLLSLAAFLLGIPTALAGSNLLFGNWKFLYGQDFFETLNKFSGNYLMPLGGILTALFVGFVMKKVQVKEEFLKGTALYRFVGVFLFLIRWIVPIAVILIILQKSNLIDLNRLLTLGKS